LAVLIGLNHFAKYMAAFIFVKKRHMVITIQINNQQDYHWLRPFLEALKGTNAVVEVKGQVPNDNGVANKRKSYLQFLEQHPIHVQKVEIPSRDERNE